jgi:hypothetical protein
MVELVSSSTLFQDILLSAFLKWIRFFVCDVDLVCTTTGSFTGIKVARCVDLICMTTGSLIRIKVAGVL